MPTDIETYTSRETKRRRKMQNPTFKMIQKATETETGRDRQRQTDTTTHTLLKTARSVNKAPVIYRCRT